MPRTSFCAGSLGYIKRGRRDPSPYRCRDSNASSLTVQAVRLARCVGGGTPRNTHSMASSGGGACSGGTSRGLDRPPIPLELRQLIRRMATETPLWSEERIANELRRGVSHGRLAPRNAIRVTADTSSPTPTRDCIRSVMRWANRKPLEFPATPLGSATKQYRTTPLKGVWQHPPFISTTDQIGRASCRERVCVPV